MGLAAQESNGRSARTEALYREHGATVAAFCRARLRDRSDAEDATQQVFLSAHRALLNGTVPREPLAWLLAVARHECYARFRQRATAPLPAAETPDGATHDTSTHALRAGELAIIWDEVEQMPAAQRAAFLLREIRGLSYGQLASELSLSPPSVRSLLLRARTRLRTRLGDVAAGVGGAQWVQTLLRLGGGEGASPVPAATKALAVGVGALALAGGGDVPRLVPHASSVAARPMTRHRPAAHERRPAAAPATAVVGNTPVDRVGLDAVERERPRGDGGSGGSRERLSHSGPDRSGSHESGADSTASGSRTGSDGGGGDSSVATTLTQPTTTGDGGGSDGGADPSSAVSSTSSDGGPAPSSSTTSSGSDGGGGSSLDGSGASDGGSGTDSPGG